MLQEIITYLVVSGAVFYLTLRFFRKKKKSCEKCQGGCAGIDFSKIDVEKTFGKKATEA